MSTVHLAVRRTGDPQAAPVLLLHALGETADSWGEVAPALARDHDVLAVDLRGHGRSPWPGTYSFAAMRDDVLGLIEDLALTRLTLIGHSMGGVVAFMVAVAAAGPVARLVVEDAAPPHRRPPREVPEPPADVVAFDWSAAVAIRREVDAGLPELWAAIERIRVPTLLVAGGGTSHVSQADIAEAGRRIQGAEVVTVDVGHEVHATAPGAFLDVVEAWLARTSLP